MQPLLSTETPGIKKQETKQSNNSRKIVLANMKHLKSSVILAEASITPSQQTASSLLAYAIKVLFLTFLPCM